MIPGVKEELGWNASGYGYKRAAWGIFEVMGMLCTLTVSLSYPTCDTLGESG